MKRTRDPKDRKQKQKEDRKAARQWARIAESEAKRRKALFPDDD